MTVSVFELHCLNALCDDYENVITVRDDIQKSMHGKVTADEVGQCIIELARKGLIDIFRLDPAAASFLPLDEGFSDLCDKWFSITPQGRVELDANWVDI